MKLLQSFVDDISVISRERETVELAILLLTVVPIYDLHVYVLVCFESGGGRGGGLSTAVYRLHVPWCGISGEGERG